MEGKSLIKVFKTNSFLIVEFTVQFIPWTKTKFSNLSVSDVAKISKSFLIISDPVYHDGRELRRHKGKDNWNLVRM
jgi:hypothetical protein